MELSSKKILHSISVGSGILREISEKSRREKMNFLLNLALFKNNDKIFSAIKLLYEPKKYIKLQTQK